MNLPNLMHTVSRPSRFELKPNSPNPFNSETVISFSIPRQGKVKLAIYDLQEEMITLLYEGKLDAGNYQLVWDGKRIDETPLTSGSYTFSLEAEGFFALRRLTIC